MKVCVVGYGAMGQKIAELNGLDKTIIVSLETEIKSLDKVSEKVDCIIDFSNPKSLDMIINYATTYHIPVVIGTTGYSDTQLRLIDELAKVVPVLMSANFSLGINLVNKLVKQITPLLIDQYDIEIVEAHHKRKLDAPSGTAKMLLKSVIDNSDHYPVYGRNLESPKRDQKEVGVHAIRGGNIIGSHEVMYCGDSEVITIKHEALNKDTFAKGALAAAKYLQQAKPGLYSMEDYFDQIIEG